MKRSALHELASFAAAIDVRHLPPDVVAKAKACLLYGAAVGIAGVRTLQPVQAVAALEDDGAAGATRFFDGGRSGAAGAAFANGTLLHARVQDDAHPAGHVGVVVIPAALAVAETTGAGGAELVAALVAGYETALRIGRDHASDLSARGFRTTPAYGVFGAAAAASRLLKLGPQQATHALALAANMAGGLREFAEAGSEDFSFQAGTAASNGILAAKLAAAGATGAATALEGAAGFFRAFGQRDVQYGARLADCLGLVFEVMAVTYKPYPICQFHRGIVRGCCALRERAHGAPLASLVIRMHPFEANFFGVQFKGPFATFPQTFMSAAFCAALAWTRGAVTFAGLTDFVARDVGASVAMIEIVADAGRERYAPRLEARLANGSVLLWEEREGAGAYALTWQTACQMTQALCAEMEVEAQAEPLISAIEGLDASSGVEPLIGSMRRACAAALDRGFKSRESKT